MRTAHEMYQHCLDNHYGRGYNQKNALKHFGIIEKNLSSDENILMTFIGIHNYHSTTKHDNNFAYAITNKRILMAQKKIVGEVFQVVLMDNLNDITLRTGMVFGIIEIDTFKEKFNVAIAKQEAENINKKIHEIIYSAKNKASIDIQPHVSMVDQLKDIKELLDLGILTQVEFDLQKAKILKSNKTI